MRLKFFKRFFGFFAGKRDHLEEERLVMGAIENSSKNPYIPIVEIWMGEFLSRSARRANKFFCRYFITGIYLLFFDPDRLAKVGLIFYFKFDIAYCRLYIWWKRD